MKLSTQFVASDIIGRHAKSLYHRLSRDMKIAAGIGASEDADAYFLTMIEKAMTRSVVNCYQYRDTSSLSPLKEKVASANENLPFDAANYNAIIALEKQGNHHPTEAEIESIINQTAANLKNNNARHRLKVVTPLSAKSLYQKTNRQNQGGA